MGISAHDLWRRNDTPYKALGLGNAGVTGNQCLDAMMAHPILISRPIVVTSRGVRLCRPSEVVLDILPPPQHGPSVKEDGEIIVAKASATR